MRFGIGRSAVVSVDVDNWIIEKFLEGYLSPFFPDPGCTGNEWQISWSFQDSPGLMSKVLSVAEERSLEGNGVTGDGETWLAWHRDSPSDDWTVELLDEGSRSLTVLIPISSNTPEYILARAIRSLLATLACSSHWAQVHASAFVFEERAALIVGSKGVGKTSLLLTALAAGADFLSNDRVLLTSGLNTVAVRGLPHSVTVRTGTAAARIMATTPSSYRDRQPAGLKQVRYHINDVLAATRRAVSGEATLGLLVIPEVIQHEGVLTRPLQANDIARTIAESYRESISSFDPLWDAWDSDASQIPEWSDARGLWVGYNPGSIELAMGAIREELLR